MGLVDEAILGREIFSDIGRITQYWSQEYLRRCQAPKFSTT